MVAVFVAVVAVAAVAVVLGNGSDEVDCVVTSLQVVVVVMRERGGR